MLDQVSALIGSIPKEKIRPLLDETFKGFNGSGSDIGSLLDSSSRLIADANAAADQTHTLIDDSGPLLSGQAESVEAIRTWAHSIAGISETLVNDDPQVRILLKDGPGAADEASRCSTKSSRRYRCSWPTWSASVKSRSPIIPPWSSYLCCYLPWSPPLGPTVPRRTTRPECRWATSPSTSGDPPACTVGFLPPSSWRSPEDTSDIDTPDGLYCKLPQDSPIGVRGARNYPCMGNPGKRAPTVEICNSDKPYEPLAMRQHAWGGPTRSTRICSRRASGRIPASIATR